MPEMSREHSEVTALDLLLRCQATGMVTLHVRFRAEMWMVHFDGDQQRCIYPVRDKKKEETKEEGQNLSQGFHRQRFAARLSQSPVSLEADPCIWWAVIGRGIINPHATNDELELHRCRAKVHPTPDGTRN